LSSKTIEHFSNTDARNILIPGTMIKVKVKKILINGLFVKFLTGFFGFIFTDHLSQELDKYEV